MTLSIGELVGYLRLDDSQFRRGLDGAARAAKRLDDSQFESGLDRASKLSSTLGGHLLTVAKGLAGVGTAAPVVVGAAAAVGQLSGAVGVLPAVFAAAKFAAATVKVGMTGMGDAMSAVASGDAAALDEAMKKLSPSARGVVREVAGLKPAWDALQLDVQERMFAGLGGEVKALGGSYLPILRTHMGGVASDMNGAAKETASFFRETEVVGDANEGMGFLRTSIGNITSELPGFVQGFYMVGRVGSEVLADVTGGAKGAGQAFADWIGEMRSSGKLEEWMRGGIDAVRKLGEIGGNVGEVLGGIFRAANLEGGGFLQRIADVTQRIADMVNSVAGQEALGTFFATAAQMSSLLMDALSAVLPVLPGVVQLLSSMAVTVGSALVGALQVAAPILSTIVDWLNQYPGVVGGAAVALFGLVAAGKGVMGLVSTLRTVQTVVTGVMTILRSQLLRTAGQYVMLMARIVGTVVMGVARIAATLLVWAAQQVARAAVALGSMVVTAASYVASWLVMAVGAMANAVAMAAAWVVAMGPVGWIIAIIVGLVALVIANWDTVKEWTVTAWNAVVDAISAAWDWIVGLVSDGIEKAKGFLLWFAELHVLAAEWFGGMARAALDKIVEFLTWLGGLPGRVLSAIGDLGSLLLNAGRDLVMGLWNGIAAMGSWLYNQILGWVKSFVPAPILQFLGIASPSKFMKNEVGRWIPEGIAAGIIGNASAAGDAARQVAMDTAAGARAGAMAGMAGGSMSGQLATARTGPAGPSADDIAAAVGSAVHGALDGARMEVDGRGVARLVNRQNTIDRRRSLTPAI